MWTELQRKTEVTSHEQRVENEPTEQDKYKNDDFLEHQSQLLQRNNKTESQYERECKERLHSPMSMAENRTEGIKRNQNVEMEVVVKKQGLSEQYKLELENQTLRKAIRELEENEEDLVFEIETLSTERHKSEAKHKQLYNKHETLRNDMVCKTKQCVGLEKEKSQMKSYVEVERSCSSELKNQLQLTKKKYEEDVKNLQDSLKKEQRKECGFTSQLGIEKETDNNGLSGNQNIQSLRNALEECLHEKREMEGEMDSAYLALEKLQKDHEEQQSDAVALERSKMKLVEDELSTLKKRDTDEIVNCRELEAKIQVINETLVKAYERNSRYEEKHGLSEAVVYQKKLEADIRRRDNDIKELNIKIGLDEDRSKLLRKAYLLIKKKAALPEDFEFKEQELNVEIAAEENRLHCQNKELTRQIEILERDRLNLMKQLRENFAQIGEKGIRFLGLSADQMLQVTTFASSLRTGEAKLPLNDESKELTAQLITIKVERESDRVEIACLKREIKVLKDLGKHNTIEDSSLDIMKNVLENIQIQNKGLKFGTQRLTELSNIEIEVKKPITSEIIPSYGQRLEEIVGEKISWILPEKGQIQLETLIKKYDKFEQDLITKENICQCQHNDQTSSVEKPNAKVTSPNYDQLTQKIMSYVSLQANKYIDSEDLMKQLNTVTSKKHLLEVHECLQFIVGTVSEHHESKQSNQLDYLLNKKIEEVEKLHIQINEIHASRTDLKEKVEEYERKLCKLQLKNEYNQNNVMGHTAIKQIKLLLEEKNKIIKRYRDKSLESPFPLSENNKQNLGEQIPNIQNDNNEDEKELRAMIILVRELKEVRAALNEKEGFIKKLAIYSSNIEKQYKEAIKETRFVKEDYSAALKQIEEIKCMYDKEMKKMEQFFLRKLEDTEKQINIRDGEVKNLQLSIQKLKHDQKEKNAMLEIEKREKITIKAALTSTRMAKINFEREIEITKTKSSEAVEEISHFQAAISKLRNEVLDAKRQKSCAIAKAKQSYEKLKKVLEHEEKQKTREEEIVILEKQIIALKGQNASLRGSLATQKLKNDNHYESSPTTKNTKKNLKKVRAKSGLCQNDVCKKDTSIVLDDAFKRINDENIKLKRLLKYENLENETQHQISMNKLDNRINVSDKLSNFNERENSKTGLKHSKHIYHETTQYDALKNRVTLERMDRKKESNISHDAVELRNEVSKETETQCAQCRTEKLKEYNEVQLLEEAMYKLKQENTIFREKSQVVQILQKQVNELQLQLNSPHFENQMNIDELQSKNAQLHLQNGKLESELCSFDLEFFEEIEDIKYKLAKYERKA